MLDINVRWNLKAAILCDYVLIFAQKKKSISPKVELSTANLVGFGCNWEVMMTKIYIDTNWFIDFYREAPPDLDWLDDLSKNKDTLVITRQTIDEFRRNRVATLKNVIGEFKKSVKVPPPHTTALIRSLPVYKELKSINENYKKKSNEVSDYLLQVIKDDKKTKSLRNYLPFGLMLRS